METAEDFTHLTCLCWALGRFSDCFLWQMPLFHVYLNIVFVLGRIGATVAFKLLVPLMANNVKCPTS